MFMWHNMSPATMFPKKDTLMEIARILNINYINFITKIPSYTEYIIQTFSDLTKTTSIPFICSSLVAIPASATLLIINLFFTRTVTNRQPIPCRYLY